MLHFKSRHLNIQNNWYEAMSFKKEKRNKFDISQKSVFLLLFSMYSKSLKVVQNEDPWSQPFLLFYFKAGFH